MHSSRCHLHLSNTHASTHTAQQPSHPAITLVLKAALHDCSGCEHSCHVSGHGCLSLGHLPSIQVSEVVGTQSQAAVTLTILVREEAGSKEPGPNAAVGPKLIIAQVMLLAALVQGIDSWATGCHDESHTSCRILGWPAALSARGWILGWMPLGLLHLQTPAAGRLRSQPGAESLQ
jgi:hypothetical protein